MDSIRFRAATIAVVALLAFLGCSKKEDKSGAVVTKPVIGVTSTAQTVATRKLGDATPAFIAAEKARVGQQSHGVTCAIAKDGTGVAFVEPVDGKFRVVFNGKAGKPYLAISGLTVSNDGKRVAYVGAVSNSLNRLIIDGAEISDYGPNDNHYFTADGAHFISTVMQGEAGRYLVIDKKVYKDQLFDQGPELGPDSRSVAYSVKTAGGGRSQLVVRDILTQKHVAFDSCGEFIYPNEDKSMLATGCVEGGKKSIKLIDLLKREVVATYPYDSVIQFMAFAPDNRSLLYTQLEPQRYVVWNGRREVTPAGDEFFSKPLVLTNPPGVGVIVGTAFRSYLYRAFSDKFKKGKEYGYISEFTANRDGSQFAFVVTNQDESQMIVVNGNEGQPFEKIAAPLLFSPDGKLVLYRARQGGKRFLVVADMKGKIVRRHQEYDMVFQPAIVAGGNAVAYGVLAGNEFLWKVEKL